MKTFKALAVALLMMTTVVGVVDAKSRVSSSRSSYSSSKSYSAPKMSAPKAYSVPKATAPSTSSQKLKDMGFSKPKPASVQTVGSRSAVGSPSKTTTTSGGWFSKSKVSSTPAPKPVYTQRKVVSPTAYRSQPRNVTVIQKNYYGGRSYGGYNGYNRGYGGYNSGGYGYSGGMGSSIMGGALGAFGGMMIYDALTTSSAEKQLQLQMNQLAANQQATNSALLQINQQNVAPAVKPQCFMPEDAPLMMVPEFYCEQPVK